MIRAVWPAVVVTSPLAAYSLHADERRSVFRDAARYDANPIPAAKEAWREIDFFLGRGNFRPVGRFFESVQRTLEFEVAEVTALPLDVVHGLFRLLMVGVLAVVVVSLVRAFVRSAGGDDDHRLVPWVPMATAAVLVAGGRASAVTSYPFALLGSAVVCLWVPQWVARDRDMALRRVSLGEAAGPMVLGATLAMIYDLIYIVPLLCIAFVAARGVAAGLATREMIRLAATRRTGALLAGFSAVFIPIRIHLHATCSDGTCYDASDLAVNTSAVRLIPDRILTGFPGAGWNYLFSASPTPSPISNWHLLGNGFVLVALAALAAFGIDALRTARAAPGRSDTRRLALGLTIFAFALALSASVVVGLSQWLQTQQFAVGAGWRETPLVQVAWALVLLGLVALLLEACSADQGRLGRALFAVAVLSVVMTWITFIANARLAQIDRQDETAAILSEIATTTVYFDATAAGNQRRCALTSRYTELHPDPTDFTGGPQVSDELDRLMLHRYGYPYCADNGS